MLLETRETYYTTGQFRKGAGVRDADASDRYRRHCGPTAITNLLLSAAARQGREDLLLRDPQTVFQRVADIGMHRLFYVNTDLLRRIGGTSDFLTGLYVRRCFREYALNAPRLRVQWLPGEAAMAAALSKGAILYLQVHLHPKYGNHHMICYGCEKDAQSGQLYFRIADGWAPRPVRMRFEDIRHAWIWVMEVYPQ